MGKLTDRKIRDAHPGATDRWLGDGAGLWLRIRANGTKTFVLRKRRDKKTTAETLGEWSGDFLVEDARDEAKKRVRQSDRLAPGVHTVAELIEEFYARTIEHRYKRPTFIKRYLDRDLVPIHALKLGQVRRSDIARVLSKKVVDGPVAANRLLAIVKRMFRYAVKVGWLAESPAELLDREVAGGEEQARQRVLSDGEIRKLWAACEQSSHGPLLRFLLLSGQRIGEAKNATWQDIREGRWFIPDNKSSRPHWVPLSSAMAALLEGRPRDGEHVFAALTLTGTQAWLRRWCAREKISPAFTPHDLRRTFATGMSSQGILPHVVEKILNHAMQGVMAVYNRHDYAEDRRQALEAWGTHVLKLVSTVPDAAHQESGGAKVHEHLNPPNHNAT